MLLFNTSAVHCYLLCVTIPTIFDLQDINPLIASEYDWIMYLINNLDYINGAFRLTYLCIYLMQICHTLTEKLVAMTMGSGAKVKAPASLSDIIIVAKRISPR